MTKDEAWAFANHWIAAWNAHDLELILTHYDDAVELTSPVAAQLLGKPDGKVVGKANLKAYFQRGLEPRAQLPARKRVQRPKQRRALLRKSEGDAHGRVHGAFFDGKSHTGCGQLHSLARNKQPVAIALSL
jgi:hypothetical protein